MTEMLWVGTSRNGKTGNVPQGYVGETIDKAKKSCDGCPLVDDCYHWKGSSQLGHASVSRGYKKNPARYTLENALKKSVRSARYARGAVGGDPSVFTREKVQGQHKFIKASGLRGYILYTHFAESKGAHLKGLAMASCDSLEQADRLMAEGWRVAYVTPDYREPGSARHKALPEWDGEEIITPDGRKGVICPAQTKRGVDCNSCGLCDATRDVAPMIVFLKH